MDEFNGFRPQAETKITAFYARQRHGLLLHGLDPADRPTDC